MKRTIKGLKREALELDFNLYRREVPIPGVTGAKLSVIDMQPEGVEQTIVFIHGYAGCAETWEFQINSFVKHYRIVAPDLRGHGQSDAPYTQYTMDEMVADLDTMVRTLKLPPQFMLIGHSFGGAICVEYANAYPERIQKLVLIATAGEYPLPKLTTWLFRIPTAVYRPFWKYRPRWNAEIHVMKRMVLNNLRKWKGWALLRNIQAQTLVLTGERDTFFPRSVFDDVGKIIPHAEVYDIGSAKHKIQLERHSAVNRAIERFLDAESRRKSWRDQDSDDEERAEKRPWLRSYSPGTPHTIPVPRQPLHRFLESAADWVPKRTATIFRGERLTYAQLNSQANQFAHALRGLGVRPGDRVVVVLPTSPQMVIAYYGILKAGGVVVMPTADAGAEAIVDTAQQVEAKLLVTLQPYADLAAKVRYATTVEHNILVDITGETLSRDQRHALRSVGRLMDDLLRDIDNDQPPGVDVQPDDLAVIAFTSGTTEQPKGVSLTHANLVANTLQTRHWVPDLEYANETCLSVLPFMHSYGMTAAMNVPIALAATLILLPVFETQQVLEHIRRYKPTIFPGIPAIYTAINHAPNVRSYGLSSIKACISGAAPLPVEVQEEFEKLTRGRLVEGYGLTEASPTTHANPLYGMRKIGSIGLPLPNTDARIVDLVTGEDVDEGKIGELVVRGPQVMHGYWDADKTDGLESIIRDGWLYTGDVALMDGDGYFQIISRKRDTIMAGEYSVYPRDVEEVLYENSKVLEAAVVGVASADPQHPGQRVKAFVVPRPGTRLSKEELLELCRRRLAEYEVPWEIEFREALPKSFAGKVLRRLLIEQPDEQSANKL